MVAVTGWGEPEDKERASAAGFDHHLTEPIDVDEMDCSSTSRRSVSPAPSSLSDLR
jgi:CheY-like chemotaxis protein